MSTFDSPDFSGDHDNDPADTAVNSYAHNYDDPAPASFDTLADGQATEPTGAHAGEPEHLESEHAAHTEGLFATPTQASQLDTPTDTPTQATEVAPASFDSLADGQATEPTGAHVGEPEYLESEHAAHTEGLFATPTQATEPDTPTDTPTGATQPDTPTDTPTGATQPDTPTDTPTQATEVAPASFDSPAPEAAAATSPTTETATAAVATGATATEAGTADPDADPAAWATNRPVHFEIHAGDVHRCVEFYTTVFGWQVQDWSEFVGGPYFGVITGKGIGIDGAIQPRMTSNNPPLGSDVAGAVLTIGVPDYEATKAAILAAGGREALAKFALPGMAWQGYFLDTENNVFGIHQPDPAAA